MPWLRHGCLLIRLTCSDMLHRYDPILEALMEFAGKLAPDWESCHGLRDAGATRAG
jgi:hypothetical protein